MATLTEVKQQRKAFDGRDTYERFTAYCKKQDLEPNKKALMAWDEHHNHFAIRDNYGTQKDVYALGLLTLYERFLVNNCMRIPNGAPVKLPNGATYQPTVTEHRHVGGRATQLRDITAQQLNVIRDQFRTELRQLLRTQKFFNLSAGDIRGIVADVLEETLAEKE